MIDKVQKKVITIDGPSASGKGTLAVKIAEALELPYLNTGAIYRALALKVLNVGVDLDDISLICQIANEISQKDLESEELRNEEVGKVASQVSAIPEVRKVLLDFQKQFANNELGAVLEGRDTGTVICPNAEYKFFVTASIEERTSRRYKELIKKEKKVTYLDILNKLKERDKRDLERAAAPLIKAEDAIELDTTNMNADEVFEFVLSKIET